MTDDQLTLRTLTEADAADLAELDGAAFGYDVPDDYLRDQVIPELEFDRAIGVYDRELDGELVGGGMILTKDLTFPGGRPGAVAAVTWVAVRPGQARRGILTRVMRDQLHGLHERGAEAVAVLTASEAAIYGRFGYGRAAGRVRIEVPSRAPLRPTLTPERVRERARILAWPDVRALYERIAPTQPGYLTRSDATWAHLYSDHPETRDGASILRFAVHPDGFASYRVKSDWDDRGPNNTLLVHELCAATPEARAALWAHLLSYDLVKTVVLRRGWPDDPIQDMLVNSRGVFRSASDHIWLRLVDLDRAVGLRDYTEPARLRVDVTDAFCPWNAGTWELDLTPEGGTARRSDQGPADLRMDIADLGAAFLGGTGVSRLAAAGLVIGEPAAVTALDRALRTRLLPYCPEGF